MTTDPLSVSQDEVRAAIDGVPAAKGSDVRSVRRLTGGVSNETFRVETDRGVFILRVAPIGGSGGNAHDMLREFEVLELARGFGAPAPEPLGRGHLKAQPERSFLIMSAIDGFAPAPGADLSLTESEANKLCRRFVTTLANLHRESAGSVGSPRVSVRPGFTGRQVAGWTRRHAKLDPDDIYEGFRNQLLRGVPDTEMPPCLIHNDYKFDNLVLDSNDHSSIRGVLDWELSGFGDPRLDLGSALAYWVEQDDPEELRAIKRGPTDMIGMLTRQELVAAYEEAARTSLSHMPFFEAFGLFKLAVIALQVDRQLANGKRYDGRFAGFAELLLERSQTRAFDAS